MNDDPNGWRKFMDTMPEIIQDRPLRVDIDEYDLETMPAVSWGADDIRTPKRYVFLNIQEPNKLIEVLFDESLKSKRIVSMTIQDSTFFAANPHGFDDFYYPVHGVCLDITLSQDPSCETNIDSILLESLVKIFPGGVDKHM